MNMLYIIPIFIITTLKCADADIVEQLGKYSNNPSARASQSALIIDEGLQAEVENICINCDTSIEKIEELCWKCSIKSRVKLFFKKFTLSSNQTSNSPLRSPQTSRKPTSYKKPKKYSIWHFLYHRIAWRKSN